VVTLTHYAAWPGFLYDHLSTFIDIYIIYLRIWDIQHWSVKYHRNVVAPPLVKLTTTRIQLLIILLAVDMVEKKKKEKSRTAVSDSLWICHTTGYYTM
jgi:hypothetical protein